MNLWSECSGHQHIGVISGTLYRIVESQEHTATLQFVDSLEEQALLEEMLEDIKPVCPADCETYHYLLKTPFRYPPLPWGSRFGREHETSIFYGGKSPETILAEAAFYRFIFWDSMDGEPPKPKIHTEHTLFSVGYHSFRGIKLQNTPFNSYRFELTHPANYNDCQQLGSAMREADVQAFEYTSARDSAGGICVGLFSPEPFIQKKPKEKNQWLCELSVDEVVFKQIDSTEIKTYPIVDFYYQGNLPLPA